MKDAVIILCGGGPAPGMNSVSMSVAKTFLTKNFRVIGLHGGYSGLFSKNARTEDLTFAIADRYFNRGGSYLEMSRFKPTDADFENNFNLDLFKDNNIKLLVTIGGDDTASTANRISKFLAAKGYPIANIHCPKTIDNDLPLPANAPTFGYNSAKNEGAHLARTVYEDARTSGNWLVISAMGRTCGSLALGIGEATHSPMTIIPEMFNKTQINLDKIIKLSLSTIIKRKLMGIDYGTIVTAEGLFHDLDIKELEAADRILYGDAAVDASPGYSPISIGLAVVQEVYWKNFAVHVAIGAYPYRHKGVNDKELNEKLDDRERGWHYEKAGVRYYFPKLGDTYVGFAIKSHSIKAEYLEFSLGIRL